MKNGIKLSIIALAVLVLSACGTKEYDQLVKKGSESLEKREYELAIARFQEASQLEPDLAAPKVMMEQAENAYFDALYEKGTEALEKLAFTEAKALFIKAYEIDEVKQPDILDKKLKVEELEKKQKELDLYTEWVAESTKVNNQLSAEWRNASSNLSIGTMNVPEFKEKMQLMLKTFQELLVSAEDEILNISGELSLLHNGYLSKLQANYEQTRYVIISTGTPEVKVEDILTKGAGLNQIQAQQANHIQTLNSYAKAQGIQYNER